MAKSGKSRFEPVEKSQADKFKDLAREIGADEDEAAFKERLKRLAKAKPKDKPEK